MFLQETDGGYNYVYDQVIAPESFGGEYQGSFHSYIFTIKMQLQSFAKGDAENLEMILRPGNGNETLTRTVLHGWSEDYLKRTKLEITYTRL